MRTRGLAKRETSRRIRLLHHIYTWSRIVGETTYILHDYQSFLAVLKSGGIQSLSRKQCSDEDCTLNSSHQSASHNTRLDDFLRIGPRFVEEETGTHGEKDAQAGLEDIHLEDPRASVEDVYHMIYGVPEKWLSLVSQTTRLANLMDAVHFAESNAIPGMSDGLLTRAVRLENAVCAFVDSQRPDEHGLSTQGFREGARTLKKPSEYMFRCLNSALLIFFYRRIRNCNSLILQTYVDDVIRGLADFDESLAKHDITGPGVPWAAFIAGCEAMTQLRRESLGKWLEKSYVKCGFQPYRQARVVMEEVWRRRDEGVIPTEGNTGTASREVTNMAPTWMNVLRQRDLCLVLF